MKKFLIKISVFGILVILLLSFVLTKYGGFVDYFYLKFTVPGQSSMILGDSRSFQGIQPEIINQEFKDTGFDLPMFNYSFTIAQINYGKPYTESIKKKLKPSKNGLFILSVHPWLFTKRANDDLEKGIYSESESPPNNMDFVNMNPNFEYLIRNLHYFHFRSIIRKTSELHKDGWLEESNLPKDTFTLNQWKEKQVNMYKGFSETFEKSNIRIDDFNDLIRFLKQNGKVVLVRMPVDSKIIEIENEFWESFDREMIEISKNHNIKYFNFSKSNKYQTYDGNHIDKYGGVIFSKELSDSIKTTL